VDLTRRRKSDVKTTRDRTMPTAIAGSYSAPLWYDASLQGRSIKPALGDTLFREKCLDVIAAVIMPSARLLH
jgi:5-methyltetrahydropteroyltriglutamate--homocysteine methyltransferase